MNKVTMMFITATLAIGAQCAYADTLDNQVPRQTLVRFADLDVTQVDGISILYGRLQQGARQVCEPLDGKTPQRASRFKHCVTDAMSRAVADVAEPQLTAYYSARLPDRRAITLQTIAWR